MSATATRKALPRPTSRAHKVLFDTNLPFRPRTERSDKEWQRHPKHKTPTGRNESSGWW